MTRRLANSVTPVGGSHHVLGRSGGQLVSEGEREENRGCGLGCPRLVPGEVQGRCQEPHTKPYKSKFSAGFTLLSHIACVPEVCLLDKGGDHATRVQPVLLSWPTVA